MDTIENLIIAIVKPLISQPDALTISLAHKKRNPNTELYLNFLT